MATGGPSLVFSCVHFREQSFQLIKFTPNLHWTMLKTPVHFLYLLVTFVATRGPTCFLLCALYRAEFSTNLLQIHTKCSLAHAPNSSSFLSPISYICGHWGANYVEHDWCSRCGGGGPGIHHPSVHDRTLLFHAVLRL